MTIRSILLVACFLPVVSCAAPAPGGEPSLPRLLVAQATLEKILTENMLPFWYPQTIDAEGGGYRLNHDVAGTWEGPADKALVTQARNVWFFARLAASPYGKPGHLAAAKHGYEFLRAKMWDREHGGFYWAVDAAGAKATKPDKHLYGQSFGLYALSTYARVARDGEALALARELFALLEKRAHDPVNGGYREAFGRDWTPLPPEAGTYMGTPAGVKLMNTHLHLMEALTAYYEAIKDPLGRERLVELIVIQSNTVVRKNMGACTDRYRPDWMPLSGPEFDRVSYGHDIENVWLLMDACAAAGLPNAPLSDLYRTLFDYSLKYGFDAERGGFFSTGPFNGPADQREKVWWVQAECLVSALRMFQLTGDAVYFDCFTRTLQWIVDRQVDGQHGDWHAEISADGRPQGQKAGAWKSAYHNGRAVLECLAVIEKLVGK